MPQILPSIFRRFVADLGHLAVDLLRYELPQPWIIVATAEYQQTS